jgi:hypothetical protein
MDARLDLGRTRHVGQDAFRLRIELWDDVAVDFEVEEATYRAAVALAGGAHYSAAESAGSARHRTATGPLKAPVIRASGTIPCLRGGECVNGC